MFDWLKFSPSPGFKPSPNFMEHVHRGVPETKPSKADDLASNLLNKEGEKPKRKDIKSIKPRALKGDEKKADLGPEVLGVKKAPEEELFPITEPAMDEKLEQEEESRLIEELGPSAQGTRTRVSSNFFEKMFPSYFLDGFLIHPATKEEYRPVTGAVLNISRQKTCSCGSNADTREIIILDPNKTKLVSHCENIQAELEKKKHASRRNLSEAEVLLYVKDYVRANIFTVKGDLESKVNVFVASKKNQEGYPSISTQKGKKVPLIPFDEFNGLGVCRHHAMATCFILDWLTKHDNRMIEGVPQVMRANIRGGAHAWVTFMGKEGSRLHLDTLWDVMIDLTHPEKISRHLLYNYGDAIAKELKRTAEAHALATGKTYNQSEHGQLPLTPREIVHKALGNARKRPVDINDIRANAIRANAETKKKLHLHKISDPEEFFKIHNKEGVYAITQTDNDYFLHYINQANPVSLALSIQLDGSILVQSIKEKESIENKNSKAYKNFDELKKALKLTQSPHDFYSQTVKLIKTHTKSPIGLDEDYFKFDSYVINKSQLGYELIFIDENKDKKNIFFTVGPFGELVTEGLVYKTVQDLLDVSVPYHKSKNAIDSKVVSILLINESYLAKNEYGIFRDRSQYSLIFNDGTNLKEIGFQINFPHGHIETETEKKYQTFQKFLDATLPKNPQNSGEKLS